MDGKVNNNPPRSRHRRTSSLEEVVDPFSTPDVYYGPKSDPSKLLSKNRFTRTRTFSVAEPGGGKGHSSSYTSPYFDTTVPLRRRGSEDDSYSASQGQRRFYIEDVDKTLKELLASEDTDGNYQITIEDTGPKVIRVGTVNSNGYKHVHIRGTYMLSNLLQELTLAKLFNRKQVILDEARLNENPVNRMTRLISGQFWKSLTRRIDSNNIAKIAYDTKIDTPKAKNPRIYVPYNCQDEYQQLVQWSEMDPSLQLEVNYLPKDITPEFVKSLNDKPGLLCLAMESHMDPVTGEETWVGFPYAVPGGRFNELYGWDSYFMALGLLESNKLDVARGMVEHFIFEIDHYGKILNANRSYYLCRSQPPFLTDMALQVCRKMGGDKNPVAVDLLRRAFKAAIKEYLTVWTASPRLDEKTGLSCYHPDGIGIPPETEPGHFDSILRKYAEKYNVSIPEFRDLYNSQKVHEPDLDVFFLHDRGVRESGHDTTYRFENVCAYLATIDLNSLLYKYEVDIAYVIKKYFGDNFEGLPEGHRTSNDWEKLAEVRKERIDKYLWDEETGFYYDYNVKTEKRTSYESVTTFWALWAGMSSQEQAQRMVENALPKLEEFGGLVACTARARGELSLDRPTRQWDYPFGWAPHQILVWDGLVRYGYENHTRRLAYRWLFLMTKAFVDYNGIVVEKYDVTRGTDPHRVDAEYGNQGADFKGVATEGFGWVNSSYLLGMKYMNNFARRALGTCVTPKVFFGRLPPKEKKKYGLE